MASMGIAMVLRRVCAAGAFVAVLGMSLACRSAHAGGIEQLARFWREVRAAEGHFTQSTVGKEGSRTKNASGRFALVRPDRLRLDYEKPYRLLVIVEGRRVTSWDAELNQASVSLLDERLGTTPAALLTGEALDKHFDLREVGQEGGLALVEVRPKDAQASFEWARIGLAENMPRRIEVRDRFGQTTTLLLGEIRVRAKLPAERFHFTPPPGAEMLGQEQ